MYTAHSVIAPYPLYVLQRGGRQRREHGVLPEQLPRPGGHDLPRRTTMRVSPVESASQMLRSRMSQQLMEVWARYNHINLMKDFSQQALQYVGSRL